uniref:Regulation of nuclear pre-mRNA domain-containing protein 1B n=1 Tax=Anthurium amnicola TaxID=1678845 RepID=A0A1D1YFK0_9ARAE
MNGTFNGQILVDKLSKLNSSQQSIETLSHWCIFHRKNAKQVVETWDRQFHCAPKSQWVSFLYLANDILQNSRRKGSEFVNEFWKVLPDSLNNVIENGDEFGRSAALRLVDIWEERKVFGSRGQVLKEEVLGRNFNNPNRDGKNSNDKLKQSVGDILEKLISNYECVYDGPVDEDTLLGKCQTAIGSVEKVEKEIGGNFMLGSVNGSQVVEELQGQSSVLRECIEQLKVTESSRMSLISHLRAALHEQELKLEQARNQLQAAQFRLEQAGNMCQQLTITNNGQLPPEQRSKDTSTFSDIKPSFIQESQSAAGEKQQSAPVQYVQQEPFPSNSSQAEEHRKTAAAAVAAKLAASTSSAEMLSYVLSSLASEGVMRQQIKDDFTSDNKRPKLDNGMPFMSPQASQLPIPYAHPDSFQQAATSQPQLQHSSSPMSHPSPSLQPPPPPPSQPPMPPPPPPAQYVQAAGSMTGVPYSYGSALPQRPPLPSFPMVNMPSYPNQPNPYQNFQMAESGFFSQPPLPATPPSASRQ